MDENKKQAIKNVKKAGRPAGTKQSKKKYKLLIKDPTNKEILTTYEQESLSSIAKLLGLNFQTIFNLYHKRTTKYLGKFITIESL